MDRVYTCPTFLTQAGFDLTGRTAALVWEVIRQASALVDSLTKQWFIAEWGEWFFSGRGKYSIAHGSEVPIGHVEAVAVSSSRSHARRFPAHVPFVRGGEQALSEFQISGRRLIRRRYPWPCGVDNIRATGYLGWVAEAKHVTGELAAAVAADDTTAVLSSVEGLRVRDIVDVYSPVPARLVVTGIDRATNTITFQSGDLLEELPVGGLFRCGGQVPRQIESLTSFFCQRVFREMGAYAEGQAIIDPARIRKELTDGYSYELFGNGESSGTSNLVTGSMTYDQIIVTFSRPNLPELV